MKDKIIDKFMINKKKIFVISGPSGVGKSTLIKMLIKEFPRDISCVVSCTTRGIREGEQDGKDYYFLKHDEFQRLINEDKFVEYVECFGNMYGTAKFAIENTISKYNSCILDLEWEGAYNFIHNNNYFTNKYDVYGILILPPSISSLCSRLQNRNSETKESLKIRLCESFNIKNVAKYDYIIVNDNVNIAYEKLKNIFLFHAKI